MDAVQMMIVLLLGAYMLQCVFAFLQSKAIAESYAEMRQHGNVLVGKEKKWLAGTTYVVFQLDNAGTVTAAQYLAGQTILARLRPLADCVGMDIHQLQFKKKRVQAAYQDALARYIEALNAQNEAASAESPAASETVEQIPAAMEEIA